LLLLSRTRPAFGKLTLQSGQCRGLTLQSSTRWITSSPAASGWELTSRKIYQDFKKEQAEEVERETREVEEEVFVHDIVQIAVRELERVATYLRGSETHDQYTN
jgi:hypothetical protein